MHSMSMMMRMDLVISFSRFDYFCLEPTELRIIRVSCPVWVTTPNTHCVFYRLEPLRRKFS